MRASLVQGVGSLLVAAAMVTAAPAALAQDAAESAEPRAGARSKGLRPPKVVVSAKAHARAAEITADAQAHYDAGRFEEAADAYRRAYAVVPAPELLFNLGQCQRQLGHPRRSVRYFEAYLRLRPDAPHRPLVEQLIAEGKLIAPAPESDRPAISATAPQGPPVDEPPAHAPDVKVPVHDVKVMPLPPPAPLPASDRTRLLADSDYQQHDSPAVYERWWFWTAVAVVAAGAAVTAYAVTASDQDSPETGTTLGTIAWD